MAKIKTREFVFGVRFKCNNCGNEQFREFMEGDEIIEEYNRVRLKSAFCSGSIDCPHCETISCENCKSQRISVKARYTKDELKFIKHGD